jgi:hypothetical protein
MARVMGSSELERRGLYNGLRLMFPAALSLDYIMHVFGGAAGSPMWGDGDNDGGVIGELARAPFGNSHTNLPPRLLSVSIRRKKQAKSALIIRNYFYVQSKTNELLFPFPNAPFPTLMRLTGEALRVAFNPAADKRSNRRIYCPTKPKEVKHRRSQ